MSNFLVINFIKILEILKEFEFIQNQVDNIFIMKKFISIIFSNFLCILFCFSQSNFFDNYVYQSWSAFGGLTGTTATDIYQTKDGFIEIGTYEGLVKFDGVEFETINRSKNKEYGFVSVRTILEDSRGDLWLGSNDEGLQKISLQNGNKIYTTENGLPNNSVRTLCEDKRGNIWVGTASGVIYITPDGKLINPQFGAGTTANGVIASNLYCDSSGRMWLTTSNENGLFICTDNLFSTKPEFEKYTSFFATAITQDFKGKFWIGLGDKGIATMYNGIVKIIKTNTLLDSIPTTTIMQDKSGTIWFGTEHGLVVYTSGKFVEYDGAQELTGSNINKIIQDREGNIWFATDRNGIGKMTQGKFEMHRLGVTVNCIAEDLEGKIWAGTDTGVLCYKNDIKEENELTKYTQGLRIRHIEATPRGKILVSCYTKPGQIIYDGKTIKHWSTDEGLAGNKVRVAIETDEDEYYVGTTTGLSIIHKDGTIKSFKQNTGELETEYIMAIHKDDHGVIWIGTDGGGIFLMKDEKIFKHITSSEGIAGNVIFKISQDKNNNFWICTGSGVTKIKDFDSSKNILLKCNSMNSEHGIGTNSVFQILFDKSGNAWITNNYGIASISTEEIEELFEDERDSVTTKYYNKNDGLDSSGPTSTASGIFDSHGRLWVPLIDGIAVYDPFKIRDNVINPLVQIESITVDSVMYKDFREMIVLKPGTKRIDIKFTGISFDAPERIMFSHMLTNFETSYSEPSMSRVVSYTNLNPGKHSFVVYAINGNELHSENDEMMFLYQKPYIYQRPIFWVLLITVIIGTVFAFFMVRERRIKVENLRLETLVQMRTADLEIEKDKSDKLLRSILPDKVADKLKELSGDKSFGEDFENVTLLFSDIVGFTDVSSGHKAQEIVSALNNLFSRFDERAKSMGVEKIKTIGDAYMAACGVPEANENHARIMIDFAKGMYEDLAKYNETAAIKFQIRIGLNCGPVTAGVIGTTKFIYDVWGNTVNVASRMETACEPGGIRITEELKNHLEGQDLKFSDPIECKIKGKGLMKTYDVL